MKEQRLMSVPKVLLTLAHIFHLISLLDQVGGSVLVVKIQLRSISPLFSSN